MEYKDYYKTLGLERSATQDEVKRPYRKLARKYHPDLNKEPDAEAQFKNVGEAYEVLGDPEKRAAYDQLGANWQAGQQFKPPPDWAAGFEFSGAGAETAAPEFSDFFESCSAACAGAGARSTRGPSSTPAARIIMRAFSSTSPMPIGGPPARSPCACRGR